jgi:hypothetical protein
VAPGGIKSLELIGEFGYLFKVGENFSRRRLEVNGGVDMGSFGDVGEVLENRHCLFRRAFKFSVGDGPASLPAAPVPGFGTG